MPPKVLPSATARRNSSLSPLRSKSPVKNVPRDRGNRADAREAAEKAEKERQAARQGLKLHVEEILARLETSDEISIELRDDVESMCHQVVSPCVPDVQINYQGYGNRWCATIHKKKPTHTQKNCIRIKKMHTHVLKHLSRVLFPGADSFELHLCMCTFVYVYLGMLMCIFVCMCSCVCVVWLCACVLVCMRMFFCVYCVVWCIFTCVYVYLCIFYTCVMCTCVCVYSYVCILVCACVLVCMCTCVHV
jgi:hypothetical protein